MSTRDGSSGWSDLLPEDDRPKPSESAPAPTPRGRRRPKPADTPSSTPSRTGARADNSRPVATTKPASSNLSLPVPNAAAPRPTNKAQKPALSLPTPSSEHHAAPAMPGSDILNSGLQDHLSGSTEPASPVASQTSLWGEYREVILSAAGGLVLLVGAIWYTQSRKPEPVVFEGTKSLVPKETAPAKPPPPEAEPVAPNPAVKKTESVATTGKTRTPMLSIVSNPAGALVEIDGVVYGKTPLIMPSPSSSNLSVTLKANGRKKWSKLVSPNEAGHFAVNADLAPQ